MLNGRPKATAAFGTDGVAFGSGGMGVSAVESGSGSSFISSATYSLNPGVGANLDLSLLTSQFVGNGFDHALFSLNENGTDIVSQTFTSLPSATAYFDDHLFSLGQWEGGALDLKIEFDLTVSGLPVGFEGFDFSYLLSSSHSPSTGTAPIPPTLLLFITALVGLGVFGYGHRSVSLMLKAAASGA